MPRWNIVLLLAAIVAALFGFADSVGQAASIARAFSFILIVVFFMNIVVAGGIFEKR